MSPSSTDIGHGRLDKMVKHGCRRPLLCCKHPFRCIQEPCMTKLHPDCIHKVQNILDHRVCTTENRGKVLSIHNRNNGALCILKVSRLYRSGKFTRFWITVFVQLWQNRKYIEWVGKWFFLSQLILLTKWGQTFYKEEVFISICLSKVL